MKKFNIKLYMLYIYIYIYIYRLVFNFIFNNKYFKYINFFITKIIKKIYIPLKIEVFNALRIVFIFISISLQLSLRCKQNLLNKNKC
jgi:hypothetical protein